MLLLLYECFSLEVCRRTGRKSQILDKNQFSALPLTFAGRNLDQYLIC